MDHVTLHFNKNMSVAVVFLDIEKPLKLLGILACYLLNFIFQLAQPSLLVDFFEQNT